MSAPEKRSFNSPGIALLCAAVLALAGLKGRSQTLNLPPRPADAPAGSQFVSAIATLSLTDRENSIYAQVLSGNVPNFLRSLSAVTVINTLSGTSHTCTYYVTPDYLAVGTDADYFLTPMTPLLAQRICDRLACTLPTRRMANQIWTNAAVKLAPQPITWSPEMVTVPVFADHNAMVREQRGTYALPLGALVSGDKKDVVISTRIYTNFANANITRPVVIYGWHYQDGVPIQSLYNGHEETYADYSHGVRLVQNALTLDGAPGTVTAVLTDPALALLLSDEGAAEGTSAGVIRVPRYPVAQQGPAIRSHPRSQTVLPGATAAFRVTATGTALLGYQWQCNGADLGGSTSSALTLTNVQLARAGSYSVVVSDATGVSTSRTAILRVNQNPQPVVFADSFDTDTSAGWNLYWGAANGIADYTVNWAFDYSTTTFTFNGATNLVPPAPNSPDGSSRAVKFTVNNNDAVGATAAVNIYPKGQQFSGNIAVKFDLWLNYPGGAGGTGTGVAGSTEHALFGLNHLGTQANWAAPSTPASDGIWFAADGEGGSSTTDYRAYVGNPAGTQIDLTPGGASGLFASNNAAPIFLSLFPAARFETAGAPGKNWVEVELRQTNNLIQWLFDGTLVAQRTNTSSFTAGALMLGYMDTYSSIAAPAKDAFVLFDNLRVEEPGAGVRFLEVSCPANGPVQLLLSALPGQTHTLETSTNLVDWTVVSSQVAGNAPLRFTAPKASAPGHRFFRARLGALQQEK